MADLTVQDAMADLEKAADPGDWDAGDFYPTITLARGASIAAILNAVLSGDLIPRADAELAVAETIRRAAEEAAAEGWPDGGLMGTSEREEGAMDCANRIEAAILALAPADALAEVQRLQARVTSLSEQVDTIAEQRDAALARVEKLREAAARVHDSYWNSTDGVILGMYDLGEALRYAALDEDARHG